MKPEPKIDKQGRPWCHEKCGAVDDHGNRPLGQCYDRRRRRLCSPAVKTMAAELEQMRGRLNRLIGYAETVRTDDRTVVDECIMCAQTKSWCDGLIEAAALAKGES